MPRPDFFIIGGVRCGTTALKTYLQEHPCIYIPVPFEPSFFSNDLWTGYPYQNLSDYLSLFDQATDKHVALGEKSTAYILSRVAVRQILELNPSAKFIVMVRDPIEMAASFHGRNVVFGIEDIANFETAWRFQARRASGDVPCPPRCPNPVPLQYGTVCKLGEQIERLYTQAPAEQVKVITFNEFSSETGRVYQEVLDFLGVESDGRTEFSRINRSRQVRSIRVSRIIRKAARLERVAGSMHPRLGGLVQRGLRYAHEVNTTGEAPRAISAHFRAELEAYFTEDRELLSNLLIKLKP